MGRAVNAESMAAARLQPVGFCALGRLSVHQAQFERVVSEISSEEAVVLRREDLDMECGIRMPVSSLERQMTHGVVGLECEG